MRTGRPKDAGYSAARRPTGLDAFPNTTVIWTEAEYDTLRPSAG